MSVPKIDTGARSGRGMAQTLFLFFGVIPETDTSLRKVEFNQNRFVNGLQLHGLREYF